MIDSRAVIDANANIGVNVSIGPFAVIGADVEIGDGCDIGSHTVIKGPTRIGQNNRIYSFASIGDDPQDKKYNGEATRLEIGDHNTIREYCTINRGTVQDKGVTRIGSHNWIMAYVHIAHDVQVGNHIILANNASLAGHVSVDDHAILGGFTLVHQFCEIGAHCFTAMNSVISKDVPPFVMVSGHMAEPHGLNIEGLKRREFSSDVLKVLRQAYKIIYRQGHTIEQAAKLLETDAKQYEAVQQLREFILNSTRGIVR
ncbi:MAG: acyl-ACP--UDP-N-acetylglucosamine O-acyltransferase [Gammaproteobacteria bacterium]|nr:acyl-ACP--UDP-N-acetylglucosamine O-acyltransferase [Gammaproteobacteria bacterium]